MHHKVKKEEGFDWKVNVSHLGNGLHPWN